MIRPSTSTVLAYRISLFSICRSVKLAIRALDEVGAEIRSLYSKTVEDLPSDFIDQLDYVITLCAEEVCPVIISKAKKLHWPLPDPAGKDGNDDEQLSRFSATRDEIRKRLEALSNDLS